MSILFIAVHKCSHSASSLTHSHFLEANAVTTKGEQEGMATEEVVVAPASEGERVQSGINLFNRWSYDEIQCHSGVVRRQTVDISHLRCVNQTLYLLTTGARESAFRNIKTIAECLADELINAAKGSSNSYAIKKKDEIERVAKANR
ncbi:hypothetical protein OROGR_013039 [Orobanche gracilis]